MKQIFTLIACIIIFYASAQPKQLGIDTIRQNVTVAQAKTMVDTNGVNPDFVILDVRTPSEFCTHHIDNAINIDYYTQYLSGWPQIDALDRNKMYLLHCAAGSRSGPTNTHMIAVHFREIYHMNSGINAWITAGYPTVTCYTDLQNFRGTKLYELYPNPAQNFLNIDFESESTGKLFLFDMQGKVLKQEILYSGFQNFNVSDISKGMYIIKIQSDKDVFTEKITIL